MRTWDGIMGWWVGGSYKKEYSLERNCCIARKNVVLNWRTLPSCFVNGVRGRLDGRSGSGSHAMTSLKLLRCGASSDGGLEGNTDLRVKSTTTKDGESSSCNTSCST